MIRIFKVKLIIICFTFSIQTKAQLDNTSFFNQNQLDTAKINKLYFDLDGLGFVKNNEYDNGIIAGRTFFGYQLAPALSYQLSDHVVMRLGAFLWKDFGNEEYTEISPVFTLKYQKNKFSMIFGNLEGNLSHRLIEPLYNFENVINNNQETGLQFLWNSKNTNIDLWVDWQKMIYPEDDVQEEIHAGVRFNQNLIRSEKLLLQSDFQANLLHKGGEIDTSDDPVFTHLSYALGLKFSVFSTNNFIKSLTFDNYLVGHTNDFLDVAFPSGNGWYLNLTAKTNFLDLMLSYWNSNEFTSPFGGDLFSSIGRNFDNADYFEAEREVLVIRFLKDFSLAEGIKGTARFEPNIDLITNRFEFTMGFYLNFRLGFLMSDKLKK